MQEILDKRIDESTSRTIKLDKKDELLLALLSYNSRATIKALARELNLSKDSVIYRIKRLQEKKIILNFYPDINFHKLGYTIFMLFVLLDESKKEKQLEWIERVRAHPNVFRIIEYSDRWDFEISIIAKDLVEMDNVIQDVISGYEDIILEKEKTALIYPLAPNMPSGELRIEKEVTEVMVDTVPVDYDSYDIKILKALSENARDSAYKIAAKIGLSPDTVRIRIKKMLDNGIISSFGVKLNLSLLGYHMHVFVCDVSLLDSKTKRKVAYRASRSSHVVSAKKLLGYWDVRVDLLTKTNPEFHETIERIKKEFSRIIRNYQTWIVYKEVLFRPFPEALMENNK